MLELYTLCHPQKIQSLAYLLMLLVVSFKILNLIQPLRILIGQHQSLKNEAERLRMICGRHRRSKSVAACFEMDPSELDPSPINWQMLDLGKLNLGGR